jgi:hypothetical protein
MTPTTTTTVPMPPIDEDASVATLATRSLSLVNPAATSCYGSHGDVAVRRIATTKPSKSATFTINHHRQEGAIQVTAASTQLGNKIAGDGKQENSGSTPCRALGKIEPSRCSTFPAALVGLAVSFCVSPFLTIVDKAIVESTNGSRTILASGLDSIRYMARNPVEYLRSPTFLLMSAVYACTYATANSFKTLEEHSSYQRERAAQSGGPQPSSMQVGKVGVFLGTTFVNSSASVVKDRAYARMFSASATQSTTSFPRATYAMWMMRDLSVIGSSFILPDIVSNQLVESYEMDRSRALHLCQLGLPVAAQLVAGPFHFLGLDLFNRNLDHKSTAEAIVDRSRKLYQGIGPVVAARMARIAPGYGIGGVLNTKWRNAWREHLIEREVKAMMSQKTHHGSPTTDYYATRLVALLYGAKPTGQSSASDVNKGGPF